MPPSSDLDFDALKHALYLEKEDIYEVIRQARNKELGAEIVPSYETAQDAGAREYTK